MTRTLTALAFLLAFSTAADARPPQQGERPTPPNKIIVSNADALGIDANTLAEIEALFAANRPAMDAAHEQARAQMEAGNEAGAREIMDAAHAEGRATMNAVMAMLTDTQQHALMELMPPPPDQRSQQGQGQGQGRR